MNKRKDLSWGRYPSVSQRMVPIRWRTERIGNYQDTILPWGNGRSYGDSCLNDGGIGIRTQGLDRFIAFDINSGLLRVESGALLSDILDFIVPYGWFLPVVPGTKFITVGGAIANDVHGKNHHKAGSFGCHVPAFQLLRSDGSRFICSPSENSDFYSATIGGLGLTGLILWAEIQLKPVQSSYIDVEEIRYHHMDEFKLLEEDSRKNFEFTVAWVDCLAKDKKLGRGVYIRGSHGEKSPQKESTSQGRFSFKIPFQFPDFILSGFSVNVFNKLYYYRNVLPKRRFQSHYDPFFFPLDAIHDWNKIYGRRGFFQYQFVIPQKNGYVAIKEIMRETSKSGAGSFLSILKVFGDRKSPGLLSFPEPGITFALDFPNRGASVKHLFEILDEIVIAAGGKIYPAKDARMSPETFRSSYPNWKAFTKHIDPKFSSSFWRRVTGGSI